MLSTLATLVLSTALGAVAGFFSGRFQERLRRHDRWKGIAAALHADLDRIRRELGEPSDKYTDFNVRGLGRAIPSLHEWTQHLIVEAAEFSPGVVAQYMELERQLNNYAMNVLKLREATAEVGHHTSQIAQGIPVAKKLEEAQLHAEMFHGGTVEMRRDAWQTMTAIDQLLRAFLPGA